MSEQEMDVTTDEEFSFDEEESLLPEVSRARPAATPPLPVQAQRPVSMIDFLSNIASDEALEANRKLAGAYDRAVRSLLGPNDVVTVDGREFKVKSAWKKLARYFQVSTQIIERREWYDRDDDSTRHFNAEVIVRATAPWGQFAEAIGLCSTREDRFQFSGPECPVCHGMMYDNRTPRPNEPQWVADKRERGELPAFACRDAKKGCPGVIMPEAVDALTLGKHPNPTAVAKALHDCTATAQTRASNRAISDLIAAGEVSAEEVGSDGSGGDASETAPDRSGSPIAPSATAGQQSAPVTGNGLLDAKVGGRGKYADRTWRDVLRDDPSYVGWMLGKEGKEPKLRVRNAKLAAALDTALAAVKAVEEPVVDRTTLDMTQAQRDCIAGFLDTKWFDSSLPDHRAMKDWCARVGRGELNPSEQAAGEAILKMSQLSEKREVEGAGMDQAEPGRSAVDDDLPY